MKNEKLQIKWFSLLICLLILIPATVVFSYENSSLEASKKLEEIRSDINTTQSDLTKSIGDTSLLEQRLGDVTDTVSTLEGQLENINEQYEKTQQRIVLTTIQIQENEKALNALIDEIALLIRKIETQKQNLKDLLVLIYFQSEKVGFFDPDDLQTIKLLLANEKVSDMLGQVDNLSMLEYALSDLIKNLDANKIKLERDKKKTEETTKQLTELKERLDKEKVFLILQKEAKEKLLEVTKGEEKLYSELLENARKEQVQIKKDFIDLLRIYSEYQDILNKDGFATDDFSKTGIFSWPVLPNLGISAYFKDPSYKKALGFEHNAIDIRVPQSTPVMAPADGVVLKTKGGTGLDYHYIVLGHNAEIMTLFGHMYEILVVPGQTVKRGEIIGLSGGMPGTRGAGWLTTGPHLHFEVLKDGRNVDPMPYMNQLELPEKYRR